MVSSVCCEVILRVSGLALDISIEGAVRMCANVLTVPAILVSNSNQMQWCERGGGGKRPGSGFEVGSLPQYPNNHDSFKLRTSFKII